jgi:hypothetical protein
LGFRFAVNPVQFAGKEQSNLVGGRLCREGVEYRDLEGFEIGHVSVTTVNWWFMAVAAIMASSCNASNLTYALARRLALGLHFELVLNVEG